MRTYRLLGALVVLLVFIAGCSDDNDFVDEVTPDLTGNEIVFEASASFENGNAANSRTIYGEKGKTFQAINWVNDDLIRIDCAQALQAKSADYAVNVTTTTNVSTTLVKQGNGLQWGTGEHTFYAVYPSPAHFNSPAATQPQTSLSGSTVTGVIPVVQTPHKVKTDVLANGEDEPYDYIFEPDMDNAYMAARAVYTTPENGVNLYFKPLVTAIEVEFNTGLINEYTSGAKNLTLTSIGLYSETQDLAGSFSANISGLNSDAHAISGAVITNTNASDADYRQVTLDLNNQNVVMEKNNKCLMTFFIHPSATFNADDSDLKLRINYTCNGVTTIRNYTIGKEVKAHKKYFFNNITLPNITEDVAASRWFSYVPDNVLISQLSIPGAGNAASNGYTGENTAWYKEQTVSLEQLWNLGVRCFEFVSDRNGNGNGLTDESLRCNGQPVGVTFGAALTTLTDLLNKSPRECLIIICNYQPYNYGRDNQDYMNDFHTSFGTVTAYNGCSFVKLNAQSTASDLRGKIAFIGRISQEGEDESTTLDNVPSFFSYIEGWGSLKDKWNRRFGNGYYPGYEQTYNMGTRSNVEDRLWSNDRNTPSRSYPESTPDFSYTVAGGGSAWVQEWMRVVPESGVNTPALATSGRQSLYMYWPGSYNEKYNNIVTTFERAKAETGNTLYINSLCGYYVTISVPTSYIPYIKNGASVTYNRTSYSNFGPAGVGAGLGGDFQTYNEAMNQRVYDYVLEQSQNNTTGPMGIVMMDYIGSTTAGTYLPSLIVQNNFKFPLRTGGN